MENGGNIFSVHTNRNRSPNGGNAGVGWDVWEPNTSRFDWANTSNSNALVLSAATTTATTPRTAETGDSTYPEASSSQALMFPLHSHYLYHHHDSQNHQQQHSLYAGDGSHLHPDPHLMCLKLGKRPYFEDTNPNPVTGSDRHMPAEFTIGKRGKSYYSNDGRGHVGVVGPSSSAAVTVARCQVEGCHVALINAKDYHRRHKVCEMHSKAPKVIVLGLEQRFCQQCSRFHVVSEFDESKRSCRRRLAGHNERRRKSSHDSVSRNSPQDKLMTGRFPCLTLPTGSALSLLSSTADSLVSPSDLSSRSSAALWELIAENRAGILARQLILDRSHAIEDLVDSHPVPAFFMPQQHQHSWDRLHDSGTQVTLDLMQAPSSAFGLLSARGKAKVEEEECSELWNTIEGARV